MDKNLQILYDQIQHQITEQTNPIVYFESNTITDIVKKIYRKSKLANTITIEFFNGYICNLNLMEFRDLVNNLTIPFLAFQQDLIQLLQSGEFVKQKLKD